MEYLLILAIVALAIAPLTHFLPSRRQRQVARMREYAAVRGLFVEFRDLPGSGRADAAAQLRPEQVIYYGLRLRPSRGDARRRQAWQQQEGEWRGIGARLPAPPGSELMPAAVLGLGIDEGSCGAYWREQGEEPEVQQIIDALGAWAAAAGGAAGRPINPA